MDVDTIPAPNSHLTQSIVFSGDGSINKENTPLSFHGRKQGASTTPHLCSRCSNLDLHGFFERATKGVEFGYITECYKYPPCPFCELIIAAVSEAWGPEWNASVPPLHMKPGKIRIFLRSKKWVRNTNHYRLLIATNWVPARFYRDRPFTSPTDRKLRRVVNEIELLPIGAVGVSQKKHVRSTSRKKLEFLQYRPVKDVLDLSLAKAWLAECESHTSCSDQILPFMKERFRVIDVWNKCLIVTPRACRYLALSYVWGATPDPMTCKLSLKNQAQLFSPGSLNLEPSGLNLPRTIRDMLTFTESIGERYVWIDTMCIIQDDPEDKALLVGRMNSIYENAVLTVIAAAGSDANAGLHGITPRPMSPYEQATLIETSNGSMTLALCRPSLKTALRKSTWNSRGWTYQEQNLSKRCIYFTEREVFFACEKHAWREDRALELAPSSSQKRIRTGPPWWSSGGIDHDPSTLCTFPRSKKYDFAKYKAAVEDFSRRDLKYEQDVVDAFTGILNNFSLYPSDDSFTIFRHAMPSQFFRLALEWQPTEPDTLRRRLPESNSSYRITFPSWSWAGWVGPVEYSDTMVYWTGRLPANPMSEITKQYPTSVHHIDYENMMQEVDECLANEDWAYLMDLESWKQSGQSIKVLGDTPRDTDRSFVICSSSSTAILGFVTLCTRLLIRKPLAKPNWFQIATQCGKFLGWVKLGSEWMEKTKPEFEGEFIVLSVELSSRYYTPVHVLLIERCGDYMERLGLGFLYTSNVEYVNWEIDIARLV